MAVKGAEDGVEAPGLVLLPPRQQKSLASTSEWRVVCEEGEGAKDEVGGWVSFVCEHKKRTELRGCLKSQIDASSER